MKTTLRLFVTCLFLCLLFLGKESSAQKQRLIHFWDFNQTLPAGGGGAKAATAGDTLGNSAHPLIASYSTESTPGHVLYVRPVGITPIILANATKSSIKGDDSIGGKDSIIDNGSPGAFYYDYSSYYYPYFKTSDSAGTNCFIRTRNPVDLTGADSANGMPFKNGAAYFYIYASTVGYKNINFNYAVSASSAAGALYSIFQYSTDGGSTWKVLTAGMDTFNTGGRMHPDTMNMINPTTAASHWYPVHIGFAPDTLVNNNPNFVIRWHNTGNQLKKNGAGYIGAVQSGNNRFDNFTIIGDTNSNQLNVAITGLTNITPCYGDSNGTATATALGGVKPYTWSWSSNALEVNGGNAASLVTDSASGLYAGTYTVTVTDNDFNSATATVTITQPSPVAGTVSAFSNVLCNGGNSGSITVTAIGGTKPYTYVWSNGATTTTVSSSASTNTLSNLTAGTYTCTVTDQYGCGNSKAIQTLTQPTALSASTSTTQVTCTVGGTATVTASGGTPSYTYSWTSFPIQTTSTATNLGTGPYTVTVTDANGCTINATATVTTSGAVITPSSTNVSCNGGNNGTASGSVTGGVTPYTYSWSTGATSTSISNLTAGTYKLTVTEGNGCKTEADITITQPALLKDTIEASGPSVLIHYWDFNTSPSGDSLGNSAFPLIADYSAIPSANPHIIYTKPVGTGQPSNNYGIDNGTPGTGLNAYASYTGNDTTGSGEANNFVRARNPVIDSAGVRPVKWQNGKSAQFIWHIPSTGYHNVTLDWAITASSTSGPSLNIMNYSTDGGTTWKALTTAMDTFTVGGRHTGDTMQVINGITSGSGWYPVHVDLSADANTNNNANLLFRLEFGGTSALNTSGNDRYDNISVSGQQYPHVLCHNGTGGAANGVATGGTAPYTYSWSNGATTSNVTSLPAGVTTLTVTDAHGCVAVATVNVTNPPLLTDSLSVSQNCYNGDSAIALINVNGGTGPFTYSWNTGGTTEQIGGLAPGTYTGTVTDHNGCTATNSITFTNPTKLTSTIHSINVACHGDNSGSAWDVAAGGTAPYSYIWKPGPNVDTIPSAPAGTYTLTLVDAQGCVTHDTIKITQPSAITAVTTYTTATCLSANGSASVSVSGGTPGYKYSWSPSGNTNATATGLSGGSYTCTITDANSCTTTASVTVPTVIETVTITSSTNDLCNGGKTGSITAGVSGGATPYTYTWTPSGGTASTASLLSAGSYTVTVHDHNGCAVTASTTLTQPTKIHDSIAVGSQVNVSCNGSSNGNVTIGVKNGTPGYHFVWTPNVSSGASASSLSAGKYTVTVSDANGCAGTPVTVTITQPGLLRDSSVVAMQKMPTCYGGTNGSATIGVKGGTFPYAYKWSTGSTANPNTALAAGTYTVTITDKNGCTSSTSVTISQPSAIRDSIASSLNDQCNGGKTGDAIVGVTGGTPGYTYMWTPSGGTASTASGLSAGNYTVTVKDKNLCSTTAKVTLTQPAAIRDSIVTGSQVNVLCNGGSTGSATIGVKNGTPGYSFSWTPNVSSSATATGLSAGKYTVVVTDAHGCTGTTLTVTITQAAAIRDSIVSATLKNVTCFGGTNGSATDGVKGGLAPYTYKWSTGSTANPDATLSAGTYTVTATDKNGCAVSTTATIGQPSAIRDSITSTLNEACNGYKTGGATVGVTGGTPGYTYLWLPSGGTAATGVNMSAGSYTVTVKDKNLCSSTAKVTLTQPSKIRDSVITASLVEVSCNGGSNGAVAIGVKDGTPGYTFSWSPNVSSASSASGLSAGVYTIIVDDANGCAGTADIVTITQPTILRDSITKVTCSTSNTGTANVGVKGGTAPWTYLWSPSGETSSYATKLIATSYTVTVTDKKGCTVQAVAVVPSCTIGAMDPASSDINTLPIDAERKVTLYPDPNNGQFTINGLEAGATVEVYNAMGALVRTIQVKDITSQFNISELPNGIYLLRIISQDGSIMAQPKMIKSW